MGVGQFDTKVAVVVRDDLATWQRLNVTAFLMAGVTAQAGAAAIGEAYEETTIESRLAATRNKCRIASLSSKW